MNALSQHGSLAAYDFVSLDAKHLPEVEQLLKANGLPFEDCHLHIEQFIGVFETEKLIAMGGFEVLGKYGLLRSVVVVEPVRGRGIASRLVEQLHLRAAAKDICRLYLLTETAEDYFLTFGYRTLSRDRLPAEIQSTRQFQSLCPASAAAMSLRL